MTRNLPLPTEHDSQEQSPAESTALLAVPDDPEDVEELTFVPATTSPSRRATAWLTCDVDDAISLESMR